MDRQLLLSRGTALRLWNRLLGSTAIRWCLLGWSTLPQRLLLSRLLAPVDPERRPSIFHHGCETLVPTGFVPPNGTCHGLHRLPDRGCCLHRLGSLCVRGAGGASGSVSPAH